MISGRLMSISTVSAQRREVCGIHLRFEEICQIALVVATSADSEALICNSVSTATRPCCPAAASTITAHAAEQLLGELVGVARSALRQR